MKNNNELDLCYKYFVDRLKEKSKHSFHGCELDVCENLNDYKSLLYYYLSDKRGFSAFPKIMSDEDYLTVDNNHKNLFNLKGNEYYHGFEEMEYGANFLWDWYYHYGEGDYGNGFYMTSDLDMAMHFTKKMFSNTKKAKERVLKAKILSDNCIPYSELTELNYFLVLGEKDGYQKILKRKMSKQNFDDLELEREKQKARRFEELVEFSFNIKDETMQKMWIKAFTNNPTAMGVYLGVDYCLRGISMKNLEENIIVFNRACLGVLESEFRRFMDNSGEKYLGLSYENNGERV